MHTEPPQGPTLEYAHILFIDIVGYSRQLIDAQVRLLDELQSNLRLLLEVRRSEWDGSLIRVPSGDGMALVFFRDLEAPVRCAIDLWRLLKPLPDMQIRMGIHSGPVYRLEDINAQANVAGAGMNMAQRVMDCGDAGHILVSSTVADVLRQVSNWQPCLHDIGECEVKHGERIHLFNLFTRDAGNPETPSRVLAQPCDRSAATVEQGVAAEPLPAPEMLPAERVAILYKRHAQDDERILRLVETQLEQRGFSVFVDRHLAVGVEWAKEIERQVREADAVIPILSEAAMVSDMLAYELQVAHKARQARKGLPRLLPVRVRYTGPLPEQIAAILDPLEYALWEGPHDDGPLLERLLRSLRNDPVTTPPAPVRAASAAPLELEAVGGAVPLHSTFYVTRDTDAQFMTALARHDSIVLIKGARQMGKTSLLARGLQKAREEGARVVLTDFQRLSGAHLESSGSFLMALALSIADQLDIEDLPDESGNARWGPTVNFERYLRRTVLRQIEGRLVWGLDEVDRLFSCGFATEVFGLFRSWHNARALDPSGPWAQLTQAIAYATEANLFITDVNQSPFNVGTRVMLTDFTPDHVGDLNQRYGAPLRDAAELARFFHLVNGHPYLTRRGLHELALGGMGLEQFEQLAGRDQGPYGDHLRRMLVLIAEDDVLMADVRRVLRGDDCPSVESFYRLQSAGILAGDTAREAHPRCRLYATYLARHLL